MRLPKSAKVGRSDCSKYHVHRDVIEFLSQSTNCLVMVADSHISLDRDQGNRGWMICRLASHQVWTIAVADLQSFLALLTLLMRKTIEESYNNKIELERFIRRSSNRAVQVVKRWGGVAVTWNSNAKALIRFHRHWRGFQLRTIVKIEKVVATGVATATFMAVLQSA